MKRAGLVLLFLTLISNAQTVTAQEKHTITSEDMVNIRSVYDANVSPDGKRVAFVVSEPADSNKPANARDENIWIVLRAILKANIRSLSNRARPSPGGEILPMACHYVRVLPDNRFSAGC